jgi:hypothetical protein
MHVKCIDKAIEELKRIKKQASLEVFVWKLRTKTTREKDENRRLGGDAGQV